jgi:glutathionyl-hydroquinone reductase
MKNSVNAMKGKSLPPNLIIILGKFVWTTMWQLMMSKLAPRDRTGAYLRPASEFHHQIGDEQYPAAIDRYHLYVGMSCPWAHRTLVVRALKGLENVVSVTTVVASAESGGWVLPDGNQTLGDVYRSRSVPGGKSAQSNYQGRCTVPMLWDKQTKSIVNNESAEIIVILNSALNEFAKHPEMDLYPEDLKVQVDQWNEKIYGSVNNGVYRCGFAQTQAAYDVACEELFVMLDELDRSLANSRYLCGDRLTLADVRLFTTLIRFDIAYFGLFKCDRHRIQDYQYLGAYLRDLYQHPAIADTCDLESIKRDYYGNLFPLNPSGIIPAGSGFAGLLQAHGRKSMQS